MLEAAKQKEVVSLANADLLAIIQSKWKRHMGIDDDGVDTTIRTVDDLANQVTLMSAQTQMEQAKRLFDPVFDDIEQTNTTVQSQIRRHERRRQDSVKSREQKLRLLAEASSSETQRPVSFTQSDLQQPQSREQRRRRLIQAAKIPWSLLDQLASERRKLEEEKTMFKVWKKPHVSLQSSPTNASSVDSSKRTHQ